MRIHLLHAVKTKLPKGLYVLMLTQYDSLGGRPLSWSGIGSNGISNIRPGITKECYHGGRFYDRVLRVEDSCYALCPPRPLLQPNFIYILELYQIASNDNNSNNGSSYSMDRIEGWTAIPMTYESMSLVEGKMKLPLLKGEHTSDIQHFKHMEKTIADDLSNWLCNIYIEIRLMSLDELVDDHQHHQQQQKNQKNNNHYHKLQNTEYDIDYINKSISIPNDEEELNKMKKSDDEWIKKNDNNNNDTHDHKDAVVIVDDNDDHRSKTNDKTDDTNKLLNINDNYDNVENTTKDDNNYDDKQNINKNNDVNNNINDDDNDSILLHRLEVIDVIENNRFIHEDELDIVKLPVDKGIFRRKFSTANNNSSSSSDIIHNFSGNGNENNISTNNNGGNDGSNNESKSHTLKNVNGTYNNIEKFLSPSQFFMKFKTNKVRSASYDKIDDNNNNDDNDNKNNHNDHLPHHNQNELIQIDDSNNNNDYFFQNLFGYGNPLSKVLNNKNDNSNRTNVIKGSSYDKIIRNRNKKSYSIPLTNNDNFIEHRKLILQKWKYINKKKHHQQNISNHSLISNNDDNNSFNKMRVKKVNFDESKNKINIENSDDDENISRALLSSPPSPSSLKAPSISSSSLLQSSLSPSTSPVTVRERSYNIHDELFLHKEQRGKIAGIETITNQEAKNWAKIGLEGKIVRRWQSEGPRFDSEAIDGDDSHDHHDPEVYIYIIIYICAYYDIYIYEFIYVYMNLFISFYK